MPVSLDPVKLSEALVELGVTPGALQAVQVASPDKGRAPLAELKVAAKARYRKLAFDLHPDRNSGDKTKSAKLSFLSQVMKEVEKLEYRPAPSRQQVVQQVVQRVVVRTVACTFVPPPGAMPERAPGPSRPGSGSRATGVPRDPRGVRVVFLRPS